MRRTVAERFWALVDKRGPDECWPWRGHRSTQGYGKFSVSVTRTGEIASRVAWELTHGSACSQMVCHRCDNPPCCNPAHLFEGSATDNMRDAAAKGRTCRGERRSAMKAGEKHHGAILDSTDVRLIRFLHSIGSRPRHLAEWFGVKAGTIGAVAYRRNWRSV